MRGFLSVPILLAAAVTTASAVDSVKLPQQDLIAARTPLRASSLIYEVTATLPRLNRKVRGPVTAEVQGVPARPVDSFVWNGDGSVWIEGSVTIRIDPIRDEGSLEARWVDENGTWTYRQDYFTHPDAHSSGVRFNSSIHVPEEVYKEAISENVYLHGDSSAGQPVLPTVFAYVAMWGRGAVTLNGEPFENPFGFPGPELWDGHIMVTEGARGADGSVRAIDGEIYDPSRASEGQTDPGDLEVHITFHDLRNNIPIQDNIPPLFRFFYHLVFEEVEMRLVQREKAGVAEPELKRGATRGR